MVDVGRGAQVNLLVVQIVGWGIAGLERDAVIEILRVGVGGINVERHEGDEHEKDPAEKWRFVGSGEVAENGSHGTIETIRRDGKALVGKGNRWKNAGGRGFLLSSAFRSGISRSPVVGGGRFRAFRDVLSIRGPFDLR